MAVDQENPLQALIRRIDDERREHQLRQDVSVIQTQLKESFVRKDALWELMESRLDDRYVQKEQWFKRSWAMAGWVLAFLVTLANVVFNVVMLMQAD